MFRTQVGDAIVLVWRQAEGEPASTGTAAPDRRFLAFGTDVFVWGRRRPVTAAPPSSGVPIFVHHYRQQGIM